MRCTRATPCCARCCASWAAISRATANGRTLRRKTMSECHAMSCAASPVPVVGRASARPTNRGGARVNMSVQRPVVLDIDGSVGELPNRLVLPLAEWQEAIRFGCSLATMRRFRTLLDAQLPAHYGTVFTGSGDFHHLSWPLIVRLKPATAIQVVVLDNHPDNMRFPFGVHCGSWVRRVAAL